MNSFIELASRGVIALHGEDRASFLNGLTTNEIPAAGTAPVYSALLSPQGKFLFDFFMLATADSILLDCARAEAPALLAKLRPYKLRAKVDMQDASEAYATLALLNEAPLVADLPAAQLYADPRHPAMGQRLLVPRDWLPDAKARLLAAGYSEATEATYTEHRLRHGVPDGATDLPEGRAIPLEYNFDLLNAISWTKGCYVGQELTARTRYRGLLRKRLFAISGPAPLPPPGTAIMKNGQEAGELRASAGHVGLAILRLEHLATEEGLTADGKPLTLHWPTGLNRTDIGAAS